MNASIVIFIMFVDFWNFGFKLGMIKRSWFRKVSIWACYVIVNCRMSYRNMILDDFFEYIYRGMDVYLHRFN